jgi:4-amino-4-deoxy-L-arabinose transferase-like glycosyltransferase
MPHMAAGDKVTWGRGDGVSDPASPRHPVTLSLILAAYLIIGALYATLTPAWQVPDEPAHYNVIRQIAQTGALPQLQVGDYDQKYLERLTSEKFPPALPLDRVQYQDYQPPLYYLLATPVFLLFNGSLIALRLFSLLLGAGVIVFGYLAVRELTRDRSAPLLAAGFIAFIPQHIALLAGVNNDSLSELVIAIGLYFALGCERRAGLLGLALGAAFLTKVQAYVLAPVFAADLFLQWRRGERDVLRRAGVMFAIAFALGALYWGRNFVVCGMWDAVCGHWHNQVVVGQPTTRDWIAAHGWWGSESALLNRFFTFTFDSFWGVFGWMGVFMPGNVYLALQVYAVAVLVGLVVAARNWRALDEGQRDGVRLLALSASITVLLYLYYNLNFVQHQGRYLFPALVPISAAAAVGMRQWGRWLRALRLPWLVEVVVPFAPVALLAALAALALFRFVIPALG